MLADFIQEQTLQNEKLAREGAESLALEQQSFSFALFALLEALFGDFGLQDIKANNPFRTDFLNAMEPEALVGNPAFVESIKDPQIRKELTGTVTAERAAEIVTMPEHKEAALRAAISKGFELYTEDCEARGVKYGFGAKSGINAIDCSGLVAKSLENAASAVGGSCRAVFNANMATNSEGQIAAAAAAGGKVLTGDDLSYDDLKAGMIIGMDTGRTSFDAGRARGIDHVVQVYRDSETGELMIGESSGGQGVHSTKASEWFEKNDHHKLYAVDMVPLVRQGYGNEPEPEAPKTEAEPEVSGNETALNHSAPTLS